MAEDINKLANLQEEEPSNPSCSRHEEFHKIKAILERLNVLPEKFSPAENVRTLCMFTVYLATGLARTLLVLLPQRMDVSGISNALETLRIEASRGRISESDEDQFKIKSSEALGRALLQVLSLVNDLPISSMKYEFAKDLAEKIISENSRHGERFESVNRVALATGFHRTVTLLTESLVGLHRQNHSETVWRLPMKVIRMLPSAGMAVPLPAPLSQIRSTIGGLLTPIVDSGQSRVVYEDDGIVVAEKLAQELIWLAQKLSECSALGEGITQWSSSGLLASMAVSANNPRVQRSLLRLSALFIHEMVRGKVEVARDIKFKLLLHWIPLFCSVTHGADGVILNRFEKAQGETTLDQAIRSLPECDQEVLLAIWLQEYAMSQSEWPNLQNCYHGWCHTTRKHAPLDG